MATYSSRNRYIEQEPELKWHSYADQIIKYGWVKFLGCKLHPKYKDDVVVINKSFRDCKKVAKTQEDKAICLSNFYDQALRLLRDVYEEYKEFATTTPEFLSYREVVKKGNLKSSTSFRRKRIYIGKEKTEIAATDTKQFSIKGRLVYLTLKKQYKYVLPKVIHSLTLKLKKVNDFLNKIQSTANL